MYQLLLLVFIACVSLISGFWLIDGMWPLRIVKSGGYWLMLFSFGTLLGSVALWVRGEREKLYQCVVTHRFGLGWAFVGVAIVILVQEFFYKTTMDELVLAATSMNLHFKKEVLTATQGYEIGGVYYLLGGFLDKRPYFFSFLVSLMHDIFGYRVGNVFILNVVLGYVAVITVYFYGVAIGGKRAGYFAMCLLLGLPLFDITMAGGGYDLLNLWMILMVVFWAKTWLEKPDSLKLIILVYWGVLLAQTRYESILYVVPIAGVVLWGWLRERKVVLPWLVVVSPALLVPYVLQNRVFNSSEVLWEMKADQVSPFGFQYVLKNLQSAWHFFMAGCKSEQLNSLLLSVLFLVLLAPFLVLAFRRGRDVKGKRVLWGIVASCGLVILMNVALMMFYYWGQFDDAMASRFALPLSLLMLFVVVWVIVRWPIVSRYQWCFTGLAIAFVFWHTLPFLNKEVYTRGMYRAREIRWLESKVKSGEERDFWISRSFLIAMVNGVAGIPDVYAPSRKVQLALMLQLHYFDRILLEYEDVLHGEYPHLLSESKWQEMFDLEVLDTHLLGPNVVLKVAEVKSVHLSPEEEVQFNEALASYVSITDKGDMDKLFTQWLP